MSGTRIVRTLLAAVFVLALLLAGRAYSPGAQVTAPLPQVQGQSFSIGSGDPLGASGVHAADILGMGGLPLIPCENLGLLCVEPTTAAEDDITGLSFGWDFVPTHLPPLQFSVATGALGAKGTAVRAEADCSPSEPEADAFETSLDGSNFQDLDGDGVACGGNGGYGLGLAEGTTSDTVDALGRDPCQYVDMDCDGQPENPIFVTLAPGSPSLDLVGATAADILVTGIEYAPLVWARGSADLGLVQGDAIDALCIQENGDGVFGPEDQVLFSLAAGSPTLASLSAGPAAIWSPGPRRIPSGEGALGLMVADDLDALVCSVEISFIAELFLPVVMKAY